MSFNTVIPVSFVAATGVTTLTKFLSGFNFIAQGTGVTLTITRDYIVQPGTGTAAIITGAGNVDTATHKYWLRAYSYSNQAGFVDSGLSASCVNTGANAQNSIIIPAQAAGVWKLELWRTAGSTTGAKLPTFTRYASDSITVNGLSGTAGNLTQGNKYTTITGFTFTDNVADANLSSTTGSIVTGTTNTSGVIVGNWFANALQSVDVAFPLPIAAGPGAWGITLVGTGTVTGALRGR